MNQDRSYPDISFVDTDTDALVNVLITSYEYFTGRKLYRGDPVRLFILWMADIIIQERVIIDQSAKQNVPRYAKEEYLDSLAENFKDVYRLPASAASVTMRFWLSEHRIVSTLIPKGTRISVDDNIIFETIEDMFIDAGALYGDIQASCQTIGAVGNGFLPGQITGLVDVFPYSEKVENITESEGGADVEDDDSFYIRIRESVESFSTAGPAGSYEYHAKTVSPLVADVSADSPEPGIADIRILLRNGELPGQEFLQKVLDYLNGDKIRPFTEKVIVSAPDIINYNIDIIYYIPVNSKVGAGSIDIEVREAVSEYNQWQSEKMGRDINPNYLTALLMKTGIKRVDIIQPQFTVVPKGAVAVLAGLAINSGGVEDE